MSDSVAQAGKRKVYEGVIEQVMAHNDDTRSLFIRVPEVREFHFVPGQFISVVIPTDERRRTRSYSLALCPEDGQPLEICLNLIDEGVGSHYLFGLDAGASLSFTGPFGLFTLERPPRHETIFVAEGTGIAPIRAMIRRALATPDPPPLKLLYVASDEAHLLYRAELEALALQHPNFAFLKRITASGRLSTLLDEIEERYVKADADRDRHFYVCGVGNDVLRVRDLLRGAGYARRAVEYERW
jgi:ferredoxin-NADP reductase